MGKPLYWLSTFLPLPITILLDKTVIWQKTPANLYKTTATYLFVVANYIGQRDDQWRTQIKELLDKGILKRKKKTSKQQTQEILMKYLGLTSPTIIEDVDNRVRVNFGRIGRNIGEQRHVRRWDAFTEDEAILSPKEEIGETLHPPEPRGIWAPWMQVKDNIEATMKRLHQKGYLQHLHSDLKEGIIDALFLTQLCEYDQMAFALDLSIKEWEFLYEQTIRIAQMQGKNIIPFTSIDKHFCEIFDIQSMKKFLPSLQNQEFIYLLNITTATAIRIMQKVMNKKKKQLSYIALATLFHYSIDFKKTQIGLSIYEKLNDDEVPLSEIKQFCSKVNNRYRKYFAGKTKFIEIYGIPNRTFYRRENDFKQFWELQCKKQAVKRWYRLKSILWFECMGIQKYLGMKTSERKLWAPPIVPPYFSLRYF